MGGDRIVQVTQRSVRLLQSESDMALDEWVPPGEAAISLVASRTCV